MLLYYITDRSRFAGDEHSRRSQLLATIVQAALCGVDYIQLREKDLPALQLETLARDVVVRLRTGNDKLKTELLINARTDIAVACGADGVHLRSDDISPRDARKIWAQGGKSTSAGATVGSSCHTRSEVARAAADGADFAVFGPVFAKGQSQPAGLEALHDACQEKIPVLALGGVTLANVGACIHAGAAGIAAIRLFQENQMDRVVATLRSLKSGTGGPTPARTKTSSL
ncbi:MAG: thiamine phosphate synthase [Terriglobales bacterium]